PDAKSQVTVEYDADGTPHRIHTDVLSTQHDESVVTKRNGKDYFSDEARKVIIDKLIIPTLKKEWHDLVKGDFAMVVPGTPPDKIPEEAIRCLVNPTGCFL